MSNQNDASWSGAAAGFVYGLATQGNIYSAIVYAYIGYTTAGAAYGLLRPDKSSAQPPKLQDNKVNAGNYGTPIPIGFGKFRTTGILIDGTILLEEQQEVEVNGQPNKYYEVLWTGAFKLCRGPITGITRIWLDQKLVYDANQGNTGPVASNYVSLSGTEPVVLNIGHAGTWHIYAGTESQGGDSFLEELHGVNNVPAYRGDAYVAIKRMNTGRYGKRVPIVSVEVVSTGTYTNGAEGPVTLNRFSSNTGATLGGVSNGLIYNPYTNRVFSRQITITASGTQGDVVQSFDAGTGATYAISNNPYVRGSSTIVMHDVILPYGLFIARTNEIIWVRNIDTGQIVAQYTFITAYGASDNGIAYHQNNNEIWTVESNQIVVISLSLMLSGASYASAKKFQFQNPFTSSAQSVSLWSINHRGWMLLKMHDGTSTFRICDGLGNYLTGFFNIGGASEICVHVVVDAVHDCFWAVTQNASGSGKCLRRYDFASSSESLIVSNLNASYFAICLDPTLACVIVYRDSDKSFVWYRGSDNLELKSFSVSSQVTTYGTPQQIAFVPNTQELFALYGETTLYRYKLDRVQTSGVEISTIVDTVMEEAGLSASDYDISAIGSTIVGGYSIDVRTQARAALEPLRSIGLFDLVDEDGKIKAKKRGGSSVMTIDYTELVMADDEEQKRPYRLKRTDEIDFPARLDIAYSDIDKDFETMTQSASRQTKRSREVATLTVPVSMDADLAKRTAEIALYSTWASRTSWELNCSRKHWKLNAGDVFIFTDEAARSRRLVCLRRDFPDMVRMNVVAIEDDATVYTNSAVGAAASWTPAPIVAETFKQITLLDIPLIENADDGAGFYVVAKPGGPVSVLYESIDGGLTYTSKAALTEAPIGYVTSVLGNFTAGNIWDDINTVTIAIADGSLSSITDAQMLAGANLCAIGNEVLQYGTATIVSPGIWSLSHLLRGRKGTEWAISGHAQGETFTVLSTTTQRIFSSIRNATVLYKAVPQGTNVSDALPVAFFNTQRGMQPYSPVNVQATRDGSGNITITWVRRSRIGSGWGSVVDMPLGEDYESYELDVMSGSTVKRTLTSTTPTVAYSAANQTTDFGGLVTTGNLLINLHQMSALVGRGRITVASV